MSDTALVIYTPSGKRGQIAVGTPVLAAARQLGVDLDSVCGGRGICSKCQVSPGQGDFAKHGLHVTETALSEFNAVEQRYDDKRGLKPVRRLGCQATIQGDVVIDVPPESQVHKQVVRKAAAARHHDGPRHAPLLRRGARAGYGRANRRSATAARSLGTGLGPAGSHRLAPPAGQAANRAAQGQLGGHGRGLAGSPQGRAEADRYLAGVL